MEALIQLFGAMLVFTYQSFDRIVINAYVSTLSRPENVVYFFQQVLGVARITKEALGERTRRYQQWVESYAGNQQIPIEWAQSDARKKDYVHPCLVKMKKQNRFGVYFILKSMEQGNSFRVAKPKYATKDPNYMRLSRTRNRFTHYYFHIRDEVLGALSIRIASFLPFQATCYLNGHEFMERRLLAQGVSFQKKENAFVGVDDPSVLQAAADALTPEIIRERLDHWIFMLGPKFSERERKAMNLGRFYANSQIEFCRNFIFRRNFPISRLFRRACELGLATLSTDKLARVFGQRVTRRINGKLQVVLDRVDHGHHILRAYLRHAFVKMYEKFSTYLRLEVCSNNLKDFGLKKGLEHLPLVRETLAAVADRFAATQAHVLNVHFDFPLLQRLALPITCGKTRMPGLKIHDSRILRLFETLLHAGTQLSGWTTAAIHEHITEAYEQPRYTRNQVRYDLRKLRARELVERDAKRNRWRLTDKGVKVAILFMLFHKRLCGPLANSLFHHKPHRAFMPDSELERAYANADKSIEKIITLLAA